MSDSGYTPSREDLRRAWWMDTENPADNEGESDVAFDAFFAAHDAVIREDERKRLADEFAKHSMSICEETMPVNDRYVTTEAWLRGQSFTGTEKQ